ncbi:MAG: glycosyltransferase family 4 protein [Phycisphaeraceae bacterium]
MPWRILFLTHRLDVSGAAVQMAKLGHALTQQGHTVAAATRSLDPGKPHGEEFFRDHGFELFEVDFPAYGATDRNATALWRSRRQLREVVHRFRPDVLHVHAPTLCLPAKLAGLGLPMTSTFHIEVLGQSKRRLARLAVRLDEKAFGERVCCISSEMKQWLEDQAGLPESRLSLVYNGIERDSFPLPTAEQRATARQRLGVASDALVVCIAALLEPRKNHRLLLQAVEETRRRGVAVELLCAGSGSAEHEASLRGLTDSLGISQAVHWLGHVDPLPVYHASDVVALPSTLEGFGQTVVEGVFAGALPIRSPSAGARDQIVDGETGYLIDPHDASALASLLVELAADVEKRERIARAARRCMEQLFTIEALRDRTLEVYRLAIKERRGEGRAIPRGDETA